MLPPVRERRERRDRLRLLLLAAACPTSDDDELAERSLGIDVAALEGLVTHHRVGALLYHRLERIDAVPQALTDALRACSIAAQARRIHAQRTLRMLDGVLEVPYLVVKGQVLASHWYDEPACREYGDVDVLVPPATFRAALASLVAAGFAPLATNWHGFRDFEVAEIPLGFESSAVDLHWDLVPIGRSRRTLTLPTVEMFERSVSITIDGLEVRTLDPVDTLIHLCVNTGLDGARRLRGLIDVDTVVRSGRIDFDELNRRVERWGTERLCSAVLQRTRSILDTPLPRDVLEQLSPSRMWLTMNATVDRRLRLGRPASSVAPGTLIAAGRPAMSSTAIAVARNVASGLMRRVGRPELTGPGGRLDWTLKPSDRDPLTDRERYLAWVDENAARVRRRRCRQVDELHALIGRLQPRTTPMLGAAYLDGLIGRRTRADLFVCADGSISGALVRHRWTVGRCTAYPLVIDQTATKPMASLIQRSSVTDLSGMESDTEPLRPYLPRWRFVELATPASLPPGFVWPDDAAGVRRAGPADVPDLVDMFWKHAPHGYHNRWLLRRRLRRAIDGMVVVLEEGDPPRAAGYAVRDSSTPEYDFWAQLIVAPDRRGHGLSWRLVAAGAADASARGVGAMVCVVDSNPMLVPSDAINDDAWTFVRLSPPRRVRGEARARAWVDAILGLPEWLRPSIGYKAVSYRNPGPRDAHVTQRRTQRWWDEHRES